MSYQRARQQGLGLLRNLNQVQDPSTIDESYRLEELEEQIRKDAELFTNTEFHDLDVGQNIDFQAPPVKPETALFEPSSVPGDVSPTVGLFDDFTTASLDFLNESYYGDYTSNYTSPTIPAFPELSLQSIQPTPQAAAAYPPPVHQQQHQQQHQAHQPGYVLPNTPITPHQHHPQAAAPVRIGIEGVVVGEKRKAEHMLAQHAPNSPPNARLLSYEDQSRLAAEEDKRKRNTAASARFRVKKKQREQALEKSAKEMTEKVNILESRISALETENKWLKGLVTEKHGGGKDDILKKLLKEFSAAQQREKDKLSKAAAEQQKQQQSEDGDSRRGSSSSVESSSSVASSITAVPAGGSEERGKRKE